jgi:glycosyltransferase involved in cell wall biosynthesis
MMKAPSSISTTIRTPPPAEVCHGTNTDSARALVRLLHVVTDPMTVRTLMRGQLAFQVAAGYQVAVASSPGRDLDAVADAEGVAVFPIGSLRREISPFADGLALWRLLAVIRRFRPQIVNAGTPKAGLLGMLAARLLGVPQRIYTLRGLRAETAARSLRPLLEGAERLAAGSAHRVLCVSHSLRLRYLELGLTSADKITVPGEGSSNGVDTVRFAPAAAATADETARLRDHLGIAPGAPVIGFVGRLTRDKGVTDLRLMFERVASRFAASRLLVVGDFERGDSVPAIDRRALEREPRAVVTGFVPDAAPYYRLMDVVAFPSHREGFPNVPLEAAASAVPVVAYRVTGSVDAVVDGVTGTLVEPGDLDGFAAAVTRYLTAGELARTHGAAGRSRAVERFRSELVWRSWLEELRRFGAPGAAPASEADR